MHRSISPAGPFALRSAVAQPPQDPQEAAAHQAARGSKVLMMLATAHDREDQIVRMKPFPGGGAENENVALRLSCAACYRHSGVHTGCFR
ncbi:hypothetical protein ZHAS_00014569 [Anopheles sinensis]|uniref:Uncharacterized protein n=1 Tax=Anopheles sinensis TaxID=74873 RepID=A0A084W8W7_ANOSI|nr:hypothetical protein ZHAS_00014569 [Anopheles sinensis]